MTVVMQYEKLSWRYSSNPKITKKSIKTPGRWLSYLPIKYAENVWQKIDQATKDGLLGYKAKISSPNFIPDREVICCILYVYTYDINDIKDVLRVREQLRKLGFLRPISYGCKKILVL